MPRVRTEAERWTFLPRLDMPRVLNRGQMTKITAAKTLFCTGVSSLEMHGFHPFNQICLSLFDVSNVLLS